MFFLIMAMNPIIAQVEVVLANGDLEFPNRLLVIGDDLYFSEDDRVSKIDLTDISPIRVTVFSDLNSTGGLSYKENDLYITEFSSSRIVKIDMTETSPASVIVTNSGKPNEMVFNDDNLYYSDNNNKRVYVHDTSSTSTVSQVLTSAFDESPIGIEFKDGFLYVTTTNVSSTNNKLFKIDINNPVPIELMSGLQRPIGIEFRGDYLYMAFLSADKIVKVDITQDPLVIEDVVSVNNPTDIEFYNDIMYITQTSNRISKVDLSSLGIDEYEEIIKIKISPNPAEDILTISNLKHDTDYILYDINGRKLKSGSINESNNKINVSDLASGTYIIRIEDSNFRFLKV